ncbi:MAG: bifunctional homocysteine S-methyltransferase/methylenetetrahydrofolate reductase [Armatimonadota bacterium]|nr:bifunctional homocysteine S-methyltransferase/methylenetetrahydrofolate reductase [Armatimonadota bacterium]
MGHRHPFLERLEQGPILCDGAMGTMLYSRGVPFDQCFDALNLTRRDLVQGIHLEYIQAGAEIIETNTFGANRIKLGQHGLEKSVRDINFWGAKIAKEARDIAGRSVFIAGSVGPLGKPLAPFGLVSPEEAREIFQEQIEALVEGGVDLLILETFFDLRELEQAVRVAKETCDLPIIAQMTFNEEGRTIMGNTPEEVVAVLDALGADVIGANCSTGPQPVYTVMLEMLKVSRKPLSAQPNAGYPARIEGRFIYPSTPAYMADYARRMVQAGVRVVGACCGTTPEHIAAIREAIQDLRPPEIRPVVVPQPVREEKTPPPVARPTELSRKLGRQFVISVEIDPPKGLDPTKDLQGARLLKEKGVDVINVGDSPMARVRMSALAMCYLIQEHVGMETIIHFTTRDRNILGLQADLIGAHAMGVRNILALTGDPPRIGDYPGATAVYDVDSIGLIRILSHLKRGTDLAGKPIGQPASFFVGCALDLNPQVRDRELPRLEQKIEAGADFIMTQFIFEPEPLLDFLEKVGKPPIPMMVGILPLQSYRQAEFLANEVPGIVIPQWVRERMRQAGNRSREEGLALAEELLKAIMDKVEGVYLMPSFGRYEVVATLVEIIRSSTPTARPK